MCTVNNTGNTKKIKGCNCSFFYVIMKVQDKKKKLAKASFLLVASIESYIFHNIHKFIQTAHNESEYLSKPLYRVP